MAVRMLGHRMARDDITKLPGGPDSDEPQHKSDSISNTVRLNFWEWVEAEHHRNKARAADPEDPYELPPLGWCSIFISGNKGDGKTTVAAALILPFYIAGYEVFHNSSLMFGIRIEVMDLYLLGEVLKGNCILVVDEIHAILSRYAQGRLADRTAIAGLATLRKKNVVIIAMTSQEPVTSHEWRGEVDFLIYVLDAPFPHGVDFQWKAPPWCYKKLAIIGYRPWRGRMLAESFGIDIFRGKRRKRTFRLHPNAYWNGAVLQYSFDKIDVGAGLSVNADQVRIALAAGEEVELVFDDPDAESQEVNNVRKAAAEAEWTLLQEMLPLYTLEHGLNPQGGRRRIPFDFIWTLYMSQYGDGGVARSARDLAQQLRGYTGCTAAGLTSGEFYDWMARLVQVEKPEWEAYRVLFGQEDADYAIARTAGDSSRPTPPVEGKPRPSRPARETLKGRSGNKGPTRAGRSSRSGNAPSKGIPKTC